MVPHPGAKTLAGSASRDAAKIPHPEVNERTSTQRTPKAPTFSKPFTGASPSIHLSPRPESSRSRHFSECSLTPSTSQGSIMSPSITVSSLTDLSIIQPPESTPPELSQMPSEILDLSPILNAPTLGPLRSGPSSIPHHGNRAEAQQDIPISHQPSLKHPPNRRIAPTHAHILPSPHSPFQASPMPHLPPSNTHAQAPYQPLQRPTLAPSSSASSLPAPPSSVPTSAQTTQLPARQRSRSRPQDVVSMRLAPSATTALERYTPFQQAQDQYSRSTSLTPAESSSSASLEAPSGMSSLPTSTSSACPSKSASAVDSMFLSSSSSLDSSNQRDSFGRRVQFPENYVSQQLYNISESADTTNLTSDSEISQLQRDLDQLCARIQIGRAHV